MKANGIRPVRSRRHKVTTDSHHSLGVAANLLDGDFLAEVPNRKWAGDISSLWATEGWLSLAVVIDLFSRRVVGWAVSDQMKKDLAMRAPEHFPIKWMPVDRRKCDKNNKIERST